MMNGYQDFVTAGRIRLGVDARASLGELAAGLGRRALVVTGGRSLVASGEQERLLKNLQQAGVQTTLTAAVDHEPVVDDVDTAVQCCRDIGCDVVVSIGGGSVMDVGKAVAGVATNEGSVADYLEGVGRNLSLQQPPLPHIAVPTTAGTGSEATKNGVIGVPAMGVKRSIRHDRLLPTVALVDPALMVGCPPTQTAYSGMDALSQLIESFISRNASPFTDALAIEGIRRAGRSLQRAVEDGENLVARTDMAFAATASGMTLGNAGLGLVHALAGPIGGMLPAPHGCLCGMLLAPVMRFNLPECMGKLALAGRLLTGQEISEDQVAAEAGIQWIKHAVEAFGFPVSLTAFGLTEDHFDEVVTKCNPGPLKTNPREAGADELRQLLAECNGS